MCETEVDNKDPKMVDVKAITTVDVISQLLLKLMTKLEMLENNLKASTTIDVISQSLLMLMTKLETLENNHNEGTTPAASKYTSLCR